MREPPVIRMLPDRRRLHLNDGPIDLIVEANGAPQPVQCAYEAAVRRFVTILDELCAELPLLRTRASVNALRLSGSIARIMAAAMGVMKCSSRKGATAAAMMRAIEPLSRGAFRLARVRSKGNSTQSSSRIVTKRRTAAS